MNERERREIVRERVSPLFFLEAFELAVVEFLTVNRMKKHVNYSDVVCLYGNSSLILGNY